MAALDDDIDIVLINEKIEDINNWIYTIHTILFTGNLMQR